MDSTPTHLLPPRSKAGSSAEPKASTTRDRYDIPVPKKINYIFLGRNFDDFNQTTFQECLMSNPDYRVRLWLDDFSMLEMEGPHGLTQVFPPASLKIYLSGMNKAISSADIDRIFAMVMRAHIEYYKVRHRNHLRTRLPTIRKFQDFLRQNKLHNVDLLFLSDFYEALLRAECQSNSTPLCYPGPSSKWENLGPEVRLLQWAFFERYRGNYAAASNLLRVQLLQTHPGIYVDHNITVPSIGDITGFRFASTAGLTASQIFLASAPKHPCLQYFRYCILQNYDALLKKDFICVSLNYTTMEKPTDPTDLNNPYITETHSLCGPVAFFAAMKDVAEGALGENVDISRAAMKDIRVNATVMNG